MVINPKRLANLLLSLLLFAGTAGAAPQAQMEAQALAALNRIRADHHLQALKPLPALREAAREHSRHMLSAGQLSHQGAGGAQLPARLAETGLQYRMLGENVAMNHNQPDPVKAAVSGWMKSEGHRANILNGQFTHTGIGIVGDAGTYSFTQIFLRPPE